MYFSLPQLFVFLFDVLSVAVLSLSLSLKIIIFIITVVANVVTIVLCVAYWHVD